MGHSYAWIGQRPTLPTRDELPIVTLAEALKRGLTVETVRWRVASGQWQRAHRGVFVTHSGPVDWMTRASAAVIGAGQGATLRDGAAGYVLGIAGAPDPEDDIPLLLPGNRRIRPLAGTTLRYADRPHRVFVPWPPHTSLEWTVLDLTREVSVDDALALVGAVLQRRRTTQARLLDALALTRRHPQRAVLRDALAEDAVGAESTLEHRWVRDVERPHGIPAGVRQVRDKAVGRARRYDIGFAQGPITALEEAAFLVELDGRLYHQGRQHVDRSKSNALAHLRTPLLRFGWVEIDGDPCAAAAEVVVMARSFGIEWPTHPCRRQGCPILRPGETVTGATTGS